MSKPAGKCVFCDKGKLTKSHIWPEWSQKILPSLATHYEIEVGRSTTFTARSAGPEYSKTTKTGSVAKRRPKNTCFGCNSGWMREIEEAAMAPISALILGRPYLLDTASQLLLATFLCLVSMRIDAGNRTARVVHKVEQNHLIKYREPPPNWAIWITQYVGGLNDDDYWYGHFPMQIVNVPSVASLKAVTIGAEHCNTQVSTLLVGKFCAHIFSSHVWPVFGQYEGIRQSQIWPVSNRYIDTRDLPPITADLIPFLHEAFAATLNPPEHLG